MQHRSAPPASASIPHFTERNQPRTAVYLPDREYGLALDALVITCVDVLLVQGDTCLLGKRRTLPRPDWWLIGGRMIAGESPLAAAQRKVQAEAGLGLAADRFQFLGVYSTEFATRSQPPQNHGLHSVNLTYFVTVSAIERQAIHLTPSEYADAQWYPWPQPAPWQQPGDAAQATVMDQCLQQILRDLRSTLGRYANANPD